uniref:CRAL-TRIO domain-containing protein n=1 Tax=Glossina morsitans morsitans TaxID=37546 RepID=A0A1B0FLE9_GLOMM
MLQIRPLNEDLQKKANEELNEVPKRMPEELRAFRTWIQQQSHLRANTDDQFLIAFLRGCKYSLEKAKGKLDTYYTLKSKFPTMFTESNVDNERFREVVRMGTFVYLPTPLHDNGPRILLFRNGLPSAEKYKVEDVWAVFHVLQDILMLEDDYAVVNGLVMVGDFREFTLAHVLQNTPLLIRKWITYNYEAMPMRVKSTHIAFAPKVFDTLYNIGRPMLPLKQQKRLFAHNNKLESLTQHVPLKYLPKEYGGENGSIPEIIDEWDKKLDQYRDYFKKSVEWGTDEKLRIGKIKDYDNMFGIEGSFKKLEVD